MKVIIAGSRDILEYQRVLDAVRLAADAGIGPISSVLCGMARGVDMLGHQWAVEHSVPIWPFPADWNKHGRRAGFLRNTAMAFHADALIAIWDGKSRGTKHMIDAATKRGLKVFVCGN